MIPLYHCQEKNLVGTINLANAELNNIDKWLISNKLALNIDKTNYILFSTKNKNRNASLKIRNVEVIVVFGVRNSLA